MDINVLNLNTSKSNVATFTITGITNRIGNAIRRTIEADLQVVVLQNIQIGKNTTKFANEFIEHRIKSMPVHIKNNGKFPLHQYMVQVQLLNLSDNIMNVTTKDFKIKNIESNTFIEDEDQEKIFPITNIAGIDIGYPFLTYLKPGISSKYEGECLEFTATFGTDFSKGPYKTTSNVVMINTPDNDQVKEAWKEKEATLKKDENFELIKNDWHTLDAQRYFVPNSFDFKIESIGVYKPLDLVKISIDILIEKFNVLKTKMANQEIMVELTECTMENAFDILLENQTETIGEFLAIVWFNLLFEIEKSCTFVSCVRTHVHNPNLILRVAFDPSSFSEQKISTDFQKVCNKSIEILEQIKNKI